MNLGPDPDAVLGAHRTASTEDPRNAFRSAVLFTSAVVLPAAIVVVGVLRGL